ncbi:MAG: NFACT family protein [Lachnospiraceae bacterium]|nr:NFACT family protein [Lachnospiraceae bacterium]
MAYDGIFIKSQINEIKKNILLEHISKITQKSQKEIIFHIRKNNTNYNLSLSANPNFPYILLSESDTSNLSTPPSFCMLLRKYLQGATIENIKQIGFKSVTKNDDSLCLERIVKFEFKNINENGDYSTYYVYFEIMGKYSNIVITDNENIILDILIKDKSDNPRLKIKEKYTTKGVTTKSDLMAENFDGFMSCINEGLALSAINNESVDLANIISKKYAGLSKPIILHIILEYLKSIKVKTLAYDFNYEIINKHINDKNSYQAFYAFLTKYIVDILLNYISLSPVINYKTNKPSDFYLFKLNTFLGETKTYETINKCLETYINEKFQDLNDTNEIKELQEIVKSLYTKLNKKLLIYNKDLEKCKDIDIYKNYGELVSCFGYNLEDIKDGILTCKDYNHNDEIVKIPVDESLTIAQNVEKYYDKYNKLKRTKDNVEKLINETTEKLEHLNTISHSLDLPNDKNDLYMIREEILNYFDEANKIQKLNKQKNDIKERKNIKKSSSHAKSKLNYNIHHFKSSTGIDIYVGKNNLQNEYLTFTLADSNDTWLHIKNATGSHVIVKMPYDKLDDKTLVEAASLAAYFSEKRNDTKATVDYTLRKELKKVKGKSPGFCIYHKNYSINVKPEITIKEI